MPDFNSPCLCIIMCLLGLIAISTVVLGITVNICVVYLSIKHFK